MSRKESEWSENTITLTLEDVLKAYNNPLEFQVDLKEIIDYYSDTHKNIIEVGCFTGVTSFILDNKFNKTLLDLDKNAIELAKRLSEAIGQNAHFVIADMFSIPIEDKTFDIVFNAGVIEHFNRRDRIKLVREYSRILKDNGILIIAFPNHYSMPYRLAYIIHNYLLFKRFWPWPKEYKLYDLKKEALVNNLLLLERRTVSKNTPMEFAKGRLKGIFEIIYKFCSFEGYLTVLIINKK